MGPLPSPKYAPVCCKAPGDEQMHIYIYKCKNIFTKMLKDVGMEVPKSIETSRQRQGMIACNNHSMLNPTFTDVGI